MKGEKFRYIKLILIIAIIVGLIGAVTYLIFGFALIWQAMAATLITVFLALIVVIMIAASIYLWIKNVMLKRELNRLKVENEKISSNLKNCNKKLREQKALDN